MLLHQASPFINLHDTMHNTRQRDTKPKRHFNQRKSRRACQCAELILPSIDPLVEAKFHEATR